MPQVTEKTTPKHPKSRARYLLVLGLIMILPIIGYLLYDLVKPMVDPCESLFRQTQLSLDSKINWLKSEGHMQVKPEKIQDLSERAQFVALNLKSCCLVLNSGQLNPEQFLQCKSSAFNYDKGLEKVVTLVKEQQDVAPNDEKNNQLEQLLQQTVDQVTTASKDFNRQILEVKSEHRYQSLSNALAAPISIQNQEAEPNDSILIANKLPLETWILAEITKPSDEDFYLFTSATIHRDFIEINIQNRSTSLQPNITLYDANKSHKQNTFDRTKGSNLSIRLLSTPDTMYYLAVSAKDYQTVGEYSLSVNPQRSYDQYEPNETVLTATETTSSQSIKAQIMDGADQDYYYFIAEQSAEIKFQLENLSTTFTPQLDLYDQHKSFIKSNFNRTAGSNLDLTHNLDKGLKYYIRVVDKDSDSAGDYQLSMTYLQP